MGIKEKEYIERINDASFDETRNLLDEYVREGYSVDNLLDNFESFTTEKKKILIVRFYNYNMSKFEEKIKSVEDCKLLIEYLLGRKLPMNAYFYMKKINDPKSFVKQDYINEMLKNVKIRTIVEDYGEYFIDEVLNIKEDYFDLLIAKDKLSKETKEKIYKKSFNCIDPEKFDEYLNYEEKLAYTNLFVNAKTKNYYFAYYLIWKKFYAKEDLDKLISLIASFAPSDIIYYVLKNEDLNKSQIKVLEKALYDTLDIEYIAYYTFYKNKKEFKRLFKNTILFLGFVSLNEHLFKNKVELQSVIKDIEKENVNYVDDVIAKIGTTYQKK